MDDYKKYCKYKKKYLLAKQKNTNQRGGDMRTYYVTIFNSPDIRSSIFRQVEMEESKKYSDLKDKLRLVGNYDFYVDDNKMMNNHELGKN